MKRRYESAYTLVEMAFVLLIIGLLAKTAIGPLAQIQEHSKRQQAERELQRVREVIFSHLVAYGALPCPMSSSSSTASVTNGYAGNNEASAIRVCSVSTGYVPASALGLAGSINADGALIDPWGREYRYTVSLSNNTDEGSAALPDWTTAGEAANVGIHHLSSDITLCNVSNGTDCSGRAIRADQIAFVVLSVASDDSSLGLQAENLDNDNYFVVTDESVIVGAEFDDLLVWGSAADVMYWMLRMGWLP